MNTSVGGMVVSLSETIEPVIETESVTQCCATPAIFPQFAHRTDRPTDRQTDRQMG